MSKTANELKLPEDGSVQAALARVHHATTNSFLVIGYTDGKNTLGVVAEGAGGVSEIQEHLIKDDARFIVLRLEHKIELTTAVKFAFIDWTPNSIKPMRRALLSTHKGQIKDISQPIHISIEAADLSDVTEGEVLGRISKASGTADNRTDKIASDSAKTTWTKPTGPAKAPAHVPDSVRSNRELKFKDEDGIRAAIKAVRADSDPTDWVLIGYTEGKIDTLELIGTGSGGVSELASTLNDQRVFYGFFRVTDQIDQSVTVKFSFLSLTTTNIPPLHKAQLGTHRGFVTELFAPYHNEFTLDKPSEFTLEIVMEKVSSTSGTRSKVVSQEYAGAAQSRVAERDRKLELSKRGGVTVPTDTAQLQLVDEGAVKGAFAEVRKDNSDTTWLLLNLDGNKLSLKESGGGEGAGEIASRLDEKSINFGLIRVSEQIDESVTTKFVYIKYTAPGVAPKTKASATTLKGAIDALFSPYSVDFFIERSDELSNDIVREKVGSTSGVRSHVVSRD